MIKNKLIEEFMEFWMMKLISCKDIEKIISVGSLVYGEVVA